MLLAFQHTNAQSKETITRLAVLEVDSAYLSEYKSFLKEGVEQALKKNPGCSPFIQWLKFYVLLILPF
jgi:hypothetical protein